MRKSESNSKIKVKVKLEKETIEMQIQITNDFDQKLAQLYSSKVTVNLDNKSAMDPNKFWNSMEMIAMNHRAMINYRLK